jgi:hypothetical protein
LSLPTVLLTLLLGGCVPRERPEGDTVQESPKAPRATSVASRTEVPEDPGPLVLADARPAKQMKRNASAPVIASASAAASAATVAASARADSKARPPALPSANVASAALAEDPLLSEPFQETFEQASLGAQWLATSAQWRPENGRLCVRNARNHPLWLKHRLPKNARIEFTATSYSNDGDIKVEMWGDGRSSAASSSYTDATGYLAIFGGWQNKFHVLARQDEHAPNRPEIKLVPDSDDPKAAPVEKDTEYTFRIERSDGKTVRWLVDDIELFAFQDKAPLSGPGHDHFGFNNWQVRVCFDDLKIVPLP